MRITPVDDKNNLFYVEDFYTDELLSRIDINEFLNDSDNLAIVNNGNAVNTRQSLRRATINNDLRKYTLTKLEEISLLIGVEVINPTVNIWIDGPGFYMGIHEDNPVIQSSLQIYLTNDNENFGTKFYHDFQHDHRNATLRHAFPYKFNCGYLMLAEPGQWHGYPITLKEDEYRMTSYTYLQKADK